jgi:hypothetical protein
MYSHRDISVLNEEKHDLKARPAAIHTGSPMSPIDDQTNLPKGASL